MLEQSMEIIRRVKYISLGDKPVEVIESILSQDNITLRMSLTLNMLRNTKRELSYVSMNICGFDSEVNLLFAKNIIVKDFQANDSDSLSCNVDISSLNTASVTITINSVAFKDGGSWHTGMEYREEETEKSSEAVEESEAFEDTDEIPVIDLPREKTLLFSEKERRKNQLRAQRLAEKQLWKDDESLSPDEIKKKRLKKWITGSIAFTLIGAIAVFGVFEFYNTSQKNQALNKAISLYDEGRHHEAQDVFYSITGLSKAKQLDYSRYLALNSIELGNYSEALYAFASMNGEGDSGTYLRQLNALLSGIVSAGDKHTLGLKTDGTVIAAGDNSFNQCSIEGWSDIIAVSAGANHSVGLRHDGSIEYTGDNSKGQLDLSDWSNLVGISAGTGHTVGVMSNGRVLSAGDNEFGQCETDDWSAVIAVSAGTSHTVGLRQDGTVVAAGDNSVNQCDIGSWQNMISVSAGNNFTVGVKSDGTVLVVGNTIYEQNTAMEFSSIAMADAGDSHGLFLAYNGRLKTSGDNDWHQCDVGLWKDLIAFSGGLHHSVGISSDGTAYSTGDNKNGQSNVAAWTDMGLPGNALDITSIK